ncbi:hypothetical protein G4D82_10080 [Flavobacterium sp. CYK-4]|uniref:hypothetical protein n=1 Tax=Flavobacterium lotistagni TaxID=2709660 RepID=UPI00140BE1EC|nr:hypothetical protein [Flavobacterium lotistagni]NHM07569.1 hypothetical protein [Flavobacterium lotistagni]
MKKTIQTLLALLLVTNVFAIDRIVQENGPSGTFSTISAAVAAALDGDRIIIYPKIGDNPYIENIVLNKTLELASAEDGVRYKIQGDISLLAANNRTITIIGAHITTGSITGSAAGWRTNVNVMGCLIEGGDITLNNQYYASVVSNILGNGSISIAHGKIIGNELGNANKKIIIANSGSIANDTINIIANKAARIECSSDVFLNIFNNLLVRNTFSDNFYSIIYNFASTTANKLNIFNNTFVLTSNNSSSYNYFLVLNSPALVKNNIFQKANNFTVNPRFSFAAGVNITASYNYYFNNSININSENQPTDLVAAPVNNTTGQLILPTAALNGADPSFEFYDLDLSVGDAGCYGGSYTLDNYFPITGSSRVYNIEMPFGITTNGGPLNIKAESFDR